MSIYYGPTNDMLGGALIPLELWPAYQIVVVCSHGGSGEVGGPGNLAWLAIAGSAPGGHRPFGPTYGFTSLHDSYTLPDGSATYEWNLTAK